MLTMNPVLQVGAYDWDAHPLPQAAFETRVSALQQVMSAQGWSGVVLFGDRPEHGSLAYLTNFAPRLAGALALIPQSGAVRVLTFDGGRMVPAGQLTTWVDGVEPAAPVTDKLTDWCAGLGGDGKIATGEFATMPSALFQQLMTVDAVAASDDATEAIHTLRRHKDAAELGVIQSSCGILTAAEAVFHAAAAEGVDVDDCAVQAESAALEAGAQDVRILVSPDAGHSFSPYQVSYVGPARPAVAYFAIRFRGYWTDGFFSALSASPLQQKVDEAADGLAGMIRPGVTVADLAAARDKILSGIETHPVVGNGFGNGLGTSLNESPLLVGAAATGLEAGDVISLQVGGIAGDAAAVSSRIVHVSETGGDVLWAGRPA